MNKVKIPIVNLFAFTGMFIWSLTIVLRETSLINNQTMQFLLGVAPNLGSVWVLPLIIKKSYPIFMKKPYNNKYNIVALILIFIAVLSSEIVHDLFLNSPFDVNDIVATVIALIIFGTTSAIVNRKTDTMDI